MIEESLKYDRDLKNMIDTAREEGIKEGMRRAEVKIQIAKRMKVEGFTNEQIKRMTGLTDEEMDKL